MTHQFTVKVDSSKDRGLCLLVFGLEIGVLPKINALCLPPKIRNSSQFVGTKVLFKTSSDVTSSDAPRRDKRIVRRSVFVKLEDRRDVPSIRTVSNGELKEVLL